MCSWQFSSLHIDEDYEPPLRVNQQGDYTCINETACVHPVDYDHYTRYVYIVSMCSVCMYVCM